MARRRIPLLISVPVLVAAFSAGIVASLWMDDDDDPPHAIVSTSATVQVAFPPADAPAQSAAPLHVEQVKPAQRVEAPIAQPAAPVVRADALPGIRASDVRADKVALTREEPPASPPQPTQSEEDEPPPVVEAKPAERIEIAHLQPEAVNMMPLPALNMPAAAPRDLRVRVAQSTPRRYYKAVRKRVRKMVDVPILGPLFGLKYYQ